MKKLNRETGKIGEEAAVGYLTKSGMTVITRNFATRMGEIDLVCRDKGTLVFVEVKTKKGYQFGRPEEMFTQAKSRRVKRMAMIYLSGRETACRIDLVGVVLDGEGRIAEIKHYVNV